MQVNQSPSAEVSKVNDHAEIDFLQLLKSLTKTWKQVLIAISVVSVIYAAIKASEIIFVVNETVYSKPIRLTFPKVQQLEFPSGAKFSYGDIVAPSIVQMVYEKNKLIEYDLSIADLQRSLSSMPYAPTYPIIISKYEKMMSDKKLTVEQLNDLQKRLEEELRQATSGEALITLRLDKKDLPKAVVDRVLNDIPSIWAESAMNEKGVLAVNVQLASVSSLNAELIKKSEGLIAGDLLYEKLALLKSNIRKMSEFEGVQSIKDPVSGMRLLDLSFAVDDLGRYVIGDMISPLRELGLSKDTKSTLYYYEDKKNKLKIALDSLNHQANAIKAVYDSYAKNDRNVSERSVDAQTASTTVVPQLSIDMLDKLVSFSGEAVRENYKQELHKKWFILTNQIADAESALADTNLVLSAVTKASTNGGKLSSVDEQYLSKVNNRIPDVLDQLSGFFNISDRIYRQLSIESVGIKDQLYVPVTNTVLVSQTLIDVQSTVLVWLALIFLTTVIVIPAVMMRNAMKGSEVN